MAINIYISHDDAYVFFSALKSDLINSFYWDLSLLHISHCYIVNT